MDERCAWVDRVIGSTDSVDAEVADHLASCLQCAAERQAHKALLGTFREIARPALSPHFRPQLMARVANERRREQRVRHRLLAMRAYWFAAAVVCGAVLANLNWPTSSSLQQTTVVLAVVAFVAPIAAMLRVFRVNFFDLIFETLMGAGGKNPIGMSERPRV